MRDFFCALPDCNITPRGAVSRIFRDRNNAMGYETIARIQKLCACIASCSRGSVCRLILQALYPVSPTKITTAVETMTSVTTTQSLTTTQFQWRACQSPSHLTPRALCHRPPCANENSLTHVDNARYRHQLHGLPGHAILSFAETADCS